MAPGLVLPSAIDISNVTQLIPKFRSEAPEAAPLDDSKQRDAARVRHHSVVSTDFDALRFKAAASSQIEISLSNHQDEDQLESSLLVSSPYNSPAHLLDLSRLPLQSVLFAKALTHLQPVLPDYATAAYEESFNWDAVLSVLRDLSKGQGHQWKQQSFYVVIFRSELQPSIDNDLLFQLDAKSHEEATESGGLLKYWFGKPNEARKNLATCEFQPIFFPRPICRNGRCFPSRSCANTQGKNYGQLTGRSRLLALS
jgi:hypothetical protein